MKVGWGPAGARGVGSGHSRAGGARAAADKGRSFPLRAGLAWLREALRVDRPAPSAFEAPAPLLCKPSQRPSPCPCCPPQPSLGRRALTAHGHILRWLHVRAARGAVAQGGGALRGHRRVGGAHGAVGEAGGGVGAAVGAGDAHCGGGGWGARAGAVGGWGWEWEWEWGRQRGDGHAGCAVPRARGWLFSREGANSTNQKELPHPPRPEGPAKPPSQRAVGVSLLGPPSPHALE
jgi:hypothetical protein